MVRDRRSPNGWKDVSQCNEGGISDGCDTQKLQKNLEKQNELRQKKEQEQQRKENLSSYQKFREAVAEGKDFQEELGKLFMFDEANPYYVIFDILVSLFKVSSSFQYLAICANIDYDWYSDPTTISLITTVEVLHIFEIILQFFKKVTPKGKSKELNTFPKVGKYYLANHFYKHFIPIIPFQFITWAPNAKGKRTYFYFLLIKVYRLQDGLNCYDVPKIMGFFKQKNLRRIRSIIANYPNLADDKILPSTDHNIGQCLIYKYVLDTIKLIIIIFTSSYVFGCFWLMLC